MLVHNACDKCVIIKDFFVGLGRGAKNIAIGVKETVVETSLQAVDFGGGVITAASMIFSNDPVVFDPKSNALKALDKNDITTSEYYKDVALNAATLGGYSQVQAGIQLYNGEITNDEASKIIGTTGFFQGTMAFTMRSLPPKTGTMSIVEQVSPMKAGEFQTYCGSKILKQACFVAGTQVIIEQSITQENPAISEIGLSGIKETNGYSNVNIAVIMASLTSFTFGILGKRDNKRSILNKSKARNKTSAQSIENIEEESGCESPCRSSSDKMKRFPLKTGSRKGFTANMLGRISIVFFLVLLGTFICSLILNSNESKASKQILASNVAHTVYNAESQRVPKYITKNIEDIQIGDRTLGVNPNGAEAAKEPDIFRTIKHNGYMLQCARENQTPSIIWLLRPENWIDSENVQIRHVTNDRVLTEDEIEQIQLSGVFDRHPDDYDLEVWLELPEMGVVGWATLIGIDEEVSIKEGTGNVVTGTFAHLSDNVIDLHLEDQTSPIGCTANHPFWSVDRKDFIEAGKLLEGEQVQLYSGETKRVVQKLPRPGPQAVYNLEVYAEHVYHVTQDGVLVHNNCAEKTVLHHCNPREVINPRTKGKSPLLPDNLANHPDIRGRKGAPNRIRIPEQKHKDIHKNGYNKRWKTGLEQLAFELNGLKNTSAKVKIILDLRDQILIEYGLEECIPPRSSRNE